MAAKIIRKEGKKLIIEIQLISKIRCINGCLCRMKGFKSHHGIRDFLDETVILFNQVNSNI